MGDEVPSYLIASGICSPSYISFEWALAYYGMIPESVKAVTSASYYPCVDMVFDNSFGRFIFSHVPYGVFHVGVDNVNLGRYMFQIATREKAVCDMLYKSPLVSRLSDLEALMFDDLRFYEEDILNLNSTSLGIIAEKYHCMNVDSLYRYVVRR